MLSAPEMSAHANAETNASNTSRQKKLLVHVNHSNIAACTNIIHVNAMINAVQWSLNYRCNTDYIQAEIALLLHMTEARCPKGFLQENLWVLLNNVYMPDAFPVPN